MHTENARGDWRRQQDNAMACAKEKYSRYRKSTLVYCTSKWPAQCRYIFSTEASTLARAPFFTADVVDLKNSIFFSTIFSCHDYRTRCA